MTARCVALDDGADAAGFKAAVRWLVAGDVPPADVVWSVGAAPDLFGSAGAQSGPAFTLPRDVPALADLVVCHRDPERYGLLYALIWRVLHGERSLLEVHSDPLVHRLGLLHKAVRRDLHKMHAFLRFRRIDHRDGERFVAWFEPDHHILDAAAPFFVERFRSLDWTIITPSGSIHWDRMTLSAGPPGCRGDVPESDAFEAGWLVYYESIFNPARANERAMLAEMPKKYWRNMPEAASIRDLLAGAPARTGAMIAHEPVPPARRDPARAVAAMARPEPQTLSDLNRQIATATSFVAGGTRAVPGEGPAGAAIAFVGEQPGDAEDLQGRPFVGPAGDLLMRALAEAGISRERSYLTNAVKHFKFVQRGKRRLHQTPTGSEIAHYRWWLDRELDLVAPGLVVALGASAALALTGKAISVTKARGPAMLAGRRGFITVHPAYLLRLPDEGAKRAAWQAFVSDMHAIAASVQLTQ